MLKARQSVLIPSAVLWMAGSLAWATPKHEGAFLVSEQLAFDQSLRYRRTIHTNEGLVAAIAEVVYQAGERFLTGTGFP